jgi:hypothetical protein
VSPAERLAGALTGWEALARAVTPVHFLGGHPVKRDDLFAPLGVGSINGSKLRQLLHLVGGAARSGAEGIVTAASVLSPQVPMTAAVASHFGLPCHIILGGTVLERARRNPGVALAESFGATFGFTSVGYNPALQAACARALDERPGWSRVPYAISLPDGDIADIEPFHRPGALQVANLHAAGEVRTLYVPFGSGNSAASVLYGLALGLTRPVEKVVLVGVGPSRLDWLARRCGALSASSGADVTGWLARCEHHDLHGAGLVAYHDRKRASLGGLALHPTYEGKVLWWLRKHADPASPWHADPRGSALWIVGSEPVAPPRSAVRRSLSTSAGRPRRDGPTDSVCTPNAG